MGKNGEIKTLAMAEEASCTMGLFGAAGALGGQVLAALESEGVPIGGLWAVGGADSVASEIMFRGKAHKVVSAKDVPLGEIDVAVIATSDGEIAPTIEALVQRGVFVLDASGGGKREGFEMMVPAHPLNFDDLQGIHFPGPIASTVGPVLHRLSTLGSIKNINIVALVGASCAGKSGAEGLSKQTLSLLNYGVPESYGLGGILAFNLLAGGYEGNQTSQAVTEELRALVPALKGTIIHHQTIRVPVFSGVGCALAVTTSKELSGLDTSAFPASSDLSIRAAGVGLRDTLDSQEVIITQLDRPNPNTMTMVCFADPLQRVATAIAEVLATYAKQAL